MTAAAPIPYADPRADFARARRMLVPPPRIRLSDWIEQHVVIPIGATPGPLRLYPYQREIADAIGDPAIERVTVVKPVRVGYTMLLVSALAGYVANDPSLIIALLPTEDDVRTFVVSEVEPTFRASPVVAHALESERGGSDRNTLFFRRFPGGSFKAVAAKAPRNLRAHTARVLFVDEADGMEVTKEGAPIELAENRTLSFDDRKIVIGSTPTEEDTSAVLLSYAQSDQRVFEVPCPACAGFTEMLWAHIEWEDDQPDTAAFRCPHCKALIPETQKHAMVAAGRFRVTRPEVTDHVGFRLNQLVSPMRKASWGALARVFLRVKSDPARLRAFVNTRLAQGWRDSGERLDEEVLAARAEPFSLLPGDPAGDGSDVQTTGIPPEVLLITVGVDTQQDRRECFLLGWQRPTQTAVPTAATGTTFCVLARHVVYGSFDDDAAWLELDRFRDMRWPHPLGGTIGIDAMMIDTGGFYAAVTAFCGPRFGRKIWPIKGDEGRRPVCVQSNSKLKGGGRLFIVGTDTIKTTLMERLARGTMIRFSKTLDLEFYRQLTSEERKLYYRHGVPLTRFERKKGMLAEALDGVVYGIAARHMLGAFNFDARAAELSRPGARAVAPPGRKVGRSDWMNRYRD